jgi:NitT/TauT family transport system substrate-binding protein
VAGRRDALTRFLAANMEGISHALANRDETLALTRKIAKLPADDPGPEFVFDEAIREKALDATLAMPVDRLQWIDGMLARHKAVDRSRDVGVFIEDAPRQAALVLIKP